MSKYILRGKGHDPLTIWVEPAEVPRQVFENVLTKMGWSQSDQYSFFRIASGSAMHGDFDAGGECIYDVRGLPEISDNASALLTIGQQNNGIALNPAGKQNQLSFEGRCAIQELENHQLVRSSAMPLTVEVTELGAEYPVRSVQMAVAQNLFLPSIMLDFTSAFEEVRLPLPSNLKDLTSLPYGGRRLPAIAKHLDFDPSAISNQGTADFYSQGYCHAFALALADKVGEFENAYFLVFLDESEVIFEGETADEDLYAVLHVYCVCDDESGNQRAFDVFGSRPECMCVDEMDGRYSRSGFSVEMDRQELALYIGEDKALAPISEEIMQEARNDVDVCFPHLLDHYATMEIC